ncbi:MAG: Uma2 family endonuclease [Pyrinomonadaceae bacterium]
MVTAFRDQKYTLEEYFELERTSEERWEFWDGHVWMMAGASAVHERIVINAASHLKSLLGRGCSVFGSNLKTIVPDYAPYRYPDLTALCGKADIQRVGGMDALSNPQMIVEILSPSTEAFDRRHKFTYYKSIPSFTEYLLIATDQANITRYSKQDDEWILTEAAGIDSQLSIPTFKISMLLSEIYLDVEFSDSRSDLILV